jgi:DeoR/GlpR family transcriptional regulator of sugar metabolism
MARRTDDVFVPAHAAKLDHRPFHAWTKLPLPWTLVTDEAADDRVVDRLRSRGIEVMVVET